MLLMKPGLSARSSFPSHRLSTDLSGGINLPAEMAKDSTEGWSLNGSDIDVIGEPDEK